MYRITSRSRLMRPITVIKNGEKISTTLTKNKPLMTEELTDEIKRLESLGLLIYSEVSESSNLKDDSKDGASIIEQIVIEKLEESKNESKRGRKKKSDKSDS